MRRSVGWSAREGLVPPVGEEAVSRSCSAHSVLACRLSLSGPNSYSMRTCQLDYSNMTRQPSRRLTVSQSQLAGIKPKHVLRKYSNHEIVLLHIG